MQKLIDFGDSKERNIWVPYPIPVQKKRKETLAYDSFFI